ncbi:MAG: AAA family ATPase [Clostridiales bacterium]|nr:AAA family ATPase [Clostridiales bacterium]
MIVLIAGATHTGKTALSQRLLKKYNIPYLSIDHLKMGLIRSGQTSISVTDDENLTPYLWQIVKEIIKTAIENGQNLIIEGCYIPFDWQKDFTAEYLAHIRYYCLIMSKDYLQNNFSSVLSYESIIEKRPDFDLTKEELIEENEKNLSLCKQYALNYILIDKEYKVDIDLEN